MAEPLPEKFTRTEAQTRFEQGFGVGVGRGVAVESAAPAEPACVTTRGVVTIAGIAVGARGPRGSTPAGCCGTGVGDGRALAASTSVTVWTDGPAGA